MRGATYPVPSEPVNRSESDLSDADLRARMTALTPPGWRATLRRWLHEHSADTRDPAGPAGRLYEVPFATVWDEVLDEVRRRPRWELRHRDEELGIISISCRTPVLPLVDDLTVFISLDGDGLTRVESLSRSRVGRGDLGTNRRRIEHLLRRLDEAVGPDHRLADPRMTGRSDPGTPPPGGRPNPS